PLVVGLGGVDTAARERAPRGEDRDLATDGEGERVGRARVDLEDAPPGLADEHGAEEGALAQIVDVHLDELSAEAVHHRLEEIMRERPGKPLPIEAELDRARLGLADADGQGPL